LGRASCQFLLQRLRDKLATLSVRAPFFFGLSMGTASYPEQGTTFDVLVRVAEEGRIEDKRRKTPGPQNPIVEGDSRGDLRGDARDKAAQTPPLGRRSDG